MKRISTEFKIGVLVTIGIALLITGVNFLKGFKVFEEQNDYVAVYKNIKGLSESNPVTLNGYKIGQIRNIDLMGNGSGKIVVTMTIFEKKLKIPEGSRAEIYSSDLLGSKAIRLKLSDKGAEGPFLEPNDTLVSSTEATLQESVNREILPVKNKAEKLISSIDSLVSIVKTIVDQEAATSLRSFDRTMKELESTANRLDGMVKDERKKIAALTNNLRNFTATLEGKSEKIGKVVDNLAIVSDSLARAEIPSAVRKAKRSLADISDITQRIDSGKGSLGKLVQTDTLHQELLMASEDLDKLLKDIRYHPDRYVHFSLFGRKDEGMDLSKDEMELLRDLLEREDKDTGEGSE